MIQKDNLVGHKVLSKVERESSCLKPSQCIPEPNQALFVPDVKLIKVTQTLFVKILGQWLRTL